MFTSTDPSKGEAYRLGGTLLLIAAAVIATALSFEHIGGYVPCPLCLMQRWAYYAAIPLLFIAMALSGEKPRVAALIFALVGLAFLANAGLAAYHAGVEWKFWPGPDTCAGTAALPAKAGDLLAGMEHDVVRCDEAAWRLFGLSFAGWNVFVSLVLMAIGFRAASAATADKKTAGR